MGYASYYERIMELKCENLKEVKANRKLHPQINLISGATTANHKEDGSCVDQVKSSSRK